MVLPLLPVNCILASFKPVSRANVSNATHSLVPSSGQDFHTNPRRGAAPADEFDDLLKEHTTQQTLRPEPKKAADMSFEELLGI